MLENQKIYEYLEFVAEMVPAPFYWSDSEGKFAGINNRVVEAVGATSKDQVIGKSVHELYKNKEICDVLQANLEEIMRTGKDCNVEDKIVDVSTGKIKYFSATRAPLRDTSGKIIGIVGTSIDITAEKEAEQLRVTNEQLKFENQKLFLENKAQKVTAQLEEHKKFRKVADQMAHDIGSPLMALSVLENSCAELPEAKRNMLRESISSIREIAGSLLNQYKPTQEEIKAADKLESKELLVYAVLQQIIIDKQYEYQHLPVKFECEYTKNSIFSFVKSDLSAFKRMLSNLINNAIEALDEKLGKVILKLDSDNEEVRVSIIDYGKGMPQLIVDKLISNIPFSLGKISGHGIGFSQVHETLEQSHGALAIDSKESIGTTITLKFPKISAPKWIVEKITIQDDDTIIILDDDSSIHGAWDIRFNEVLKINPNVTVKHFSQAKDVIYFVNSLTNKSNIILLSDYELLKQKLNGLDVIERTQIRRSILVTSHYTDINIRRQAYKSDTKILPKILASEINICMDR